MEETKTKLMKVKASVDTNRSPKKSPQSLSATQRRDNNDSYLDSFPAGYRFCPFDAELIIYYLKKKLMNQPLPPNKINDVNLYHFNPHDLAQMYKGLGEKEEEFYFFTPRDRKYRNGTRPNRAAGDGYWKATGADKSIKFNSDIVGFKKTLVFYKGKPPKGDKTFWIMHEYRVNDDSPPRSKTRLSTDMRLDDWVLCRIYYKERVDKSLKSFNRKDDRVSCEKTSSYNRSYMHHPNWEQNAAAVSQIGSFKDVAMDEQFQHDGTGMDMLFGSTNDIFWSSYHQDNFCFETHLDFTNRFDDTLIVKDLSDNFHN